jgi:hypothetical protein
MQDSHASPNSPSHTLTHLGTFSLGINVKQRMGDVEELVMKMVLEVGNLFIKRMDKTHLDIFS